MGTLNTHGFDKCKPPVCAEDIDITIVSKICTDDKVLHIEWTVTDKYGRDIDSNIIQWSCDSKNFNNMANSENSTQPYKTSFDISDCEGVVYFRVKIRIGSGFVYGEEEVTNNSECLAPSTTVVRASWCGDCHDTVTTPPSYTLYARTSTIPSYPVYFSFDGFCWSVNDNDPILDLEVPEGSQITDISENYESCFNCCERLSCPSEWEELPISAQSFAGERKGSFYFEYQTYRVPDRIFIVKNFDASDCDPEDPNKLPANEDVLFDTGCVSTNLEDSPQFFVSEPVCLEMISDTNTYGFCLDIRESDLPLGVVIDCACEEINPGSQAAATLWKICVIDPEGNQNFYEGGNECLCVEIEEPEVPELPEPPVIGTRWVEEAPNYGVFANYAWALTTFQNRIYGGFDDGLLLSWSEGDSSWTEEASLSDARILSLRELGGQLYASTGQTSGGSPNSGLLLRWDGVSSWDILATKFGTQTEIHDLAELSVEIYGCSGGDGKLLKWDGVSAWTELADNPGFNRLTSMVTFNGKVYIGTNEGELQSYPGSGTTMDVEAPVLGGINYINRLIIFDDGAGDAIYASTGFGDGDEGNLLKWNGTDAWEVVCPKKDSIGIVKDIIEFNDTIYGAALTDGELLEWDRDTDLWNIVAPQHDAGSSRMQSLTVLGNILYGGTGFNSGLSQGKLLSWAP